MRPYGKQREVLGDWEVLLQLAGGIMVPKPFKKTPDVPLPFFPEKRPVLGRPRISGANLLPNGAYIVTGRELKNRPAKQRGGMRMMPFLWGA